MKFLIVDDEPIIRKGIRRLLENSHIVFAEIEEARNGEEALQLIASGKPDLVVTDIQMNVMDGLELIGRIRQSYADIELIVLTGYADFHYVQTALRHQVADYLLKPITQESLNEVLSKTLLRNPSKWTTRMDAESIRTMARTVHLLAKSVMSEQREEAFEGLREWFGFCGRTGYSWSELKRAMGHFELLFHSELYLVLKEMPQDRLSGTDTLPGSVDELLLAWEAYLTKLMAYLSDKRSPRNKRTVDEAIRFIETDFGSKELNLQTIAARVGVNAPYLSKMFREVAGRPITQYVTEYRLEKARTMLANDPDAKIVQVAEACGFNDYPYFSKVFKKHYGVSPLEYKEKN